MSAKHTVDVTEELAVPAEFLWKTISDFEHIDAWSRLKVLSIEGNGIGCTRTVEMETGARVTEKLTHCDRGNMIFGYQIMEPNPYPMQDYQSTVSIEKTSDRSCRIVWSGCYGLPEGTDPLRTDNLLRKVYGNGIQLLVSHYARNVGK